MAHPAVLIAVDHDAEASPTVRFAGQELRRLLVAATGRRVSVLDAAAEPSAALVLAVDPGLADHPADDVLAIEVADGVGTITGSNERSLLIAVYRFLTELGCRFVRPGPDGEYLPRIDPTAAVTVRERAAHRHRGLCIEGATSLTNLLDLIDWLPKVGMNSYFIQFDSPHVFLRSWYERRGDPAGGPDYPTTGRSAEVQAAVLAEIERRGLVHHAVGHGWTSEVIGVPATGWDVVDDADFRRDLVAEVNGVRELWGGIPLNTELCYSNPEARSAMARVIADHAVAHPEIDVVHVWLSDGNANHCECAECRTRRPADWYLMLLNELDQLLTEASSPATVAFLAYHQLLWPPVTETLENPDRFVLMFAPIRRDPRVPMASAGDGRIASYEGNATTSPVANEEFVDLLQAWRQGFTGSAFDFDYHLMWQYAFDPGQLIIARTLYDDIRGFHGIGLDGLISCQTQRIFVPDGFVLTIMARTLWDPSISYEQAHAEHLAATFGPDGAAVGQHLQRLSDVVAGWDLDHRGVCQPRIDPAEVSTVHSMLAELMELCHHHLADDQPVWAASWQNLLWYSEVWTGLCGVWDALAADDRSVLWQRWDEVKASLWQGQDDHQPVLDASNLTLTIERFLDRVLPAGTAAD